MRLPIQTGNPELDFLNELYTTALRDGVSPYSLQVENGSFVIPHGDHNHYIKVQTKGFEVALKTRFQPCNLAINLELLMRRQFWQK